MFKVSGEFEQTWSNLSLHRKGRNAEAFGKSSQPDDECFIKANNSKGSCLIQIDGENYNGKSLHDIRRKNKGENIIQGSNFRLGNCIQFIKKDVKSMA